MHSYFHHIGDYRADTSHLSLLEHGVYRQMLDTYYLNESPLPVEVDMVCRKLSARTDEEREAVASVLKEFFDLTEDGWTHKRCETEIAKYLEFKEAGKRGAAKRWGAKATPYPPYREGNGEGNAPPNQGPIATSNHKPETSKPSKAQAPVNVDRFADFWAAYPRKVAKPEAMKAWIKIKPDEETAAAIMAGLEQAKKSRDWLKDDGQFIPHPSTWLNQRRWEDQMEAAVGGDDPFVGLI